VLLGFVGSFQKRKEVEKENLPKEILCILENEIVVISLRSISIHMKFNSEMIYDMMHPKNFQFSKVDLATVISFMLYCMFSLI
jgi:hypothetical protein